MNQDQSEHKKFLEKQLQWTEVQVRILNEMNDKLHEMKIIAEYVKDHELSAIEFERLNGQLNTLKNECNSLERKHYIVVH